MLKPPASKNDRSGSRELYRIEDATHTDGGETDDDRFNELNHSKDGGVKQQSGFTVLKNGALAINK